MAQETERTFLGEFERDLGRWEKGALRLVRQEIGAAVTVLEAETRKPVRVEREDGRPEPEADPEPVEARWVLRIEGQDRFRLNHDEDHGWFRGQWLL